MSKKNAVTLESVAEELERNLAPARQHGGQVPEQAPTGNPTVDAANAAAASVVAKPEEQSEEATHARLGKGILDAIRSMLKGKRTSEPELTDDQVKEACGDAFSYFTEEQARTYAIEQVQKGRFSIGDTSSGSYNGEQTPAAEPPTAEKTTKSVVTATRQALTKGGGLQVLPGDSGAEILLTKPAMEGVVEGIANLAEQTGKSQTALAARIDHLEKALVAQSKVLEAVGHAATALLIRDGRAASEPLGRGRGVIARHPVMTPGREGATDASPQPAGPITDEEAARSVIQSNVLTKGSLQTRIIDATQAGRMEQTRMVDLRRAGITSFLVSCTKDELDAMGVKVPGTTQHTGTPATS